MIKDIMVAITTVAMLTSASMVYLTLTRLKSEKREYFILMIICVFIFELAYIFEMTASTTDGAFIATKLMYIGTQLLGPMYFFFIQKYCEKEVPKIVNLLLFATSLVFILLVWTSDCHTLYYTSYWYDDTGVVPRLAIAPGPLYLFGVLHPISCVILSAVVIIKKIHNPGKIKRKRLYILIYGALTPIVSAVLYFFNFDFYAAVYVPLSLMLAILVSYYSLLKYDLLENEETVRSQTWLKEMIGNVSHDLKTPLTVLGQYLELLNDSNIALSDIERAEYIHVAHRKNLNIQRLIRNLFEATRIESGQVAYKMEWWAISNLMTELEDRYEKYLREQGLTFVIENYQDRLVKMDVDKIWSIFDNIIYNAARHAPGGTITVSSEYDGNICIISIADTGEGIAEEHLPKIFDRFYKVSKSRTEGDSGIGLYIAKVVTEGMGGTITVRSRVGEGTVFSITLESSVPSFITK